MGPSAKWKCSTPHSKSRKKFLLFFHGVSWPIMFFIWYLIWCSLNHRNTWRGRAHPHTCLHPCPSTQGGLHVLEQDGSNCWAQIGKWEAREPNWEVVGGRTTCDLRLSPWCMFRCPPALTKLKFTGKIKNFKTDERTFKSGPLLSLCPRNGTVQSLHGNPSPSLMLQSQKLFWFFTEVILLAN